MKKLSKTHRQNISNGLKGHIVPEKIREKISNTLNNKFVGVNNFNWRGGETKDKNGYILIRQPKHPFCNGVGYIRRSRLVMEKMIGRYLRPEEVVHHINDIKDDDREKNLKLFANNGKHRKFHKPNKNKIGQFI